MKVIAAYPIVIAFIVIAFIAGAALSPRGGSTQEGAKKPLKIARFAAGGAPAHGLVEGDRVRQIEGDIFGAWKPGEKTHALKDVKILVPVTPSKVLALAGNYRSHLDNTPPPANPELFFKVPSCLIAPGESILIPPGTSDVHFEAELVIVIGKRAKSVTKEKALEHVLGVTCGNDVSARDWQKNDRQWWRAKGSDTFGPCGPYIVSGINYDDLAVELRQNGQVKQKERTSQLIHGVAAIVSWASRHVTLEPGDLIYTGTPGQTSALKPGDTVEVEIEGVGVLKNGVAAAKE
ncbi:MAG TPA: fumarylacetoacetate hydrolase family protein [Planctomycetota bacterium]|nr:fumarylacetoacetate hydrolase family protein [Planctomycetota bacterium]